jgi:hypothetical protein
MTKNLKMGFFRKAFGLLLIWLTVQGSIFGQCAKVPDTYKPGEILTYDAYYNWGFIWVHAANIEFSVKSIIYHSKPVLHFSAIGNSRKNYDWIYKVRDSFQSYVDKETFQPIWFERRTSEGGYNAYENYVFNPSKSLVISATENSKKPLAKDTITVKPCTFDVLTAVYLCRSLNFENVKINQKIPVNTIIDNKVYPLYIRYLGNETIKTRTEQKFKCIKFSVLLVEGTIFKGGEDMTIWVTDDANRVPVLVEAKILIGSVKAYLNTTQGLAGELKALIK